MNRRLLIRGFVRFFIEECAQLIDNQAFTPEFANNQSLTS